MRIAEAVRRLGETEEERRGWLMHLRRMANSYREEIRFVSAFLDLDEIEIAR